VIETTHLFVLAILIFVFGLFSKAFAKSIVTAPMAFVAFGLLLAPDVCQALGLGHIFGELEHLDSTIHLLGEITLVVVLFTDAAQIQLKALVKGAAIPSRLLLIGMPITIILGALIASFFFEQLGIWELALLATMLAPTDAALGQAVVTSKRVPLKIRQGLSVESGLNDGIAVPLVLIFASLASVGYAMSQASHHEPMTGIQCATFAAKQVIYGPLVGILVGLIGAWLMTKAIRHGWMQHAYREIAGLTLAIIAFVGAGYIGGNGFIAAFVAGLVMGNSSKEVRENLYDFAEAEAQLLMLTTFFLVGLVLVWEPLNNASWHVWAYAFLSLTLIRMLPVALALIGLKLQKSTVAFIGWFGPRGLASVLFSVLVIKELPVPNADLIVQIVIITVLLSVIAHGITAAPLSVIYASKLENNKPDELVEFGSCPSAIIKKRAFIQNENPPLNESSSG
jgi:sodium/hydrogen antiporter